uniref:Regulator of chromosome condensation n=1 Tax=Romanomermis culicivorax TaxID=13658 RepID=A0A915IHR7_ROMCU
MIHCGEDYTLAGTSDNQLYFWGTKSCSEERHGKTAYHSDGPNYSGIENDRSQIDAAPLLKK